ncbi:MAG: hypothetical protein EOP69_00795 [Spirochaetia bacterium]|nr:MAG: hypothetical protein EOP69_00795 [Spirochaetia bacterium]
MADERPYQEIVEVLARAQVEIANASDLEAVRAALVPILEVLEVRFRGSDNNCSKIKEITLSYKQSIAPWVRSRDGAQQWTLLKPLREV